MIFKRYLTIPTQGLFHLNSEKLLIRINGADSLKFLNGLTTSKLLPTFIKKNQYTISDGDDDRNHSVQITDEELTHSNFGIIHEDCFLENDDVDKIGIRRDGIFTMLLNSKGRVLTDLFIYPTPFNFVDVNEPSYLLEMDKSIVGKVSMMLKMHKLKSNLQISIVNDYQIWYYYNDSLKFNQLLSILEENYFNNLFNKTPAQCLQSSDVFVQNELIFNKQLPILGFALDNRSYLNGLKFITKTNDPMQLFNSDFQDLIEPSLTRQDLKLYHLRNNLKGVVEKSDLSKSIETLPFEHNLDLMNGISYDKGCYVGQELTIRTKNLGTVRKRIFPFKILTECKDDVDENFDVDLINTEIELASALAPTATSPFDNTTRTKKRKQTAGKILSMNYNVGYILMNLRYLDEQFQEQEYQDFALGEYRVRVMKPEYYIDQEEELL